MKHLVEILWWYSTDGPVGEVSSDTPKFDGVTSNNLDSDGYYQVNTFNQIRLWKVIK